MHGKYTNENLKLNIDLKHVDESVKGPVHLIQDSKNKFDIVSFYPIEFQGNNGVSGKIDFGLRLRVNNTYSQSENKNMWYFQVAKSDKATILEYKCNEDKKWCDDVKEYMENDFVKLFLTFDQGEHGYDQP